MIFNEEDARMDFRLTAPPYVPRNQQPVPGAPATLGPRLRAYPNNPAALRAIRAHREAPQKGRCSWTGDLSQRTNIRRKRFSQL